MSESMIGHNNPPIAVRMQTEHAGVFARIAELKASCAAVPEKITDDATAGKVQDLVKMVRLALKAAKDARDAERAPFKQSYDEVNATFNIPAEELEKARDAAMTRLQYYLDDKAAKEKAAREEAARIQREQAEKAAREAAEAEERKREAERQRLAAEKAAREAEERERAAKAAAIAAEARAKAAREEAQKIEQQNAAEAERLRQQREHAEREALHHKAEADRATVDKVVAKNDAHTAKREESEAARETLSAQSTAVRFDRRASKIERSAESEADLARTRGELGSVGTLARRWVYRVVDYDKVPIEKLRPFLQRDAIDAAIYRLMQTGVRELPGVVFEQEQEARVS
jgi:chemotaxis protein histidine kinase CheA